MSSALQKMGGYLLIFTRKPFPLAAEPSKWPRNHRDCTYSFEIQGLTLTTLIDLVYLAISQRYYVVQKLIRLSKDIGHELDSVSSCFIALYIGARRWKKPTKRHSAVERENRQFLSSCWKGFCVFSVKPGRAQRRIQGKCWVSGVLT